MTHTLRTLLWGKRRALLAKEMINFGDRFPLEVANPMPAEWTPPSRDGKSAAKARTKNIKP